HALRTHEAHVNCCTKSVMGMIRTNIGCSLSAANVLFTGLQGQHIAPTTFAVFGEPDQAAGYTTDKILLTGKDSDGLATSIGIQTKGLAFPYSDISVIGSRRCEHAQAVRVGYDNEK